MGFFKRLMDHYAAPKDPSSKRYRREAAERYVGKAIKYVSERSDDNVEEVLGKSGSMTIRDGEFIVYASQNIVFRCNVDDLVTSELLSKDGVILTGPDIENGGRERTVIAYYVYYR